VSAGRGHKEREMQVRIDLEKCTGHGRCYTLAPTVFGSDDSGFGNLLHEGDLDPSVEREAELAAANCPEGAVELRATPQEG
jgi:ferredoxin